MEILKSGDLNYIKYGAYLIRKYFEENESVNSNEADIEAFISSGIFHKLCEFINTQDDNCVVYEVLCSLINYTGLDNIQPHVFNIIAEAFCKEEMINSLHRILSSKYNELKEGTLWLLCHLFADTYIVRDAYINSKVYKEVIKYFNEEDNLSLSLLRYHLWFLSSFGKNINQTGNLIEYETIMEILKIFVNFIHTEDQDCMNNVIWGIYYLSRFTQYEQTLFRDIINSGCLAKIMKINLKTNEYYQTPILKLYGNLCSGTASDIQQLLDLNLLDLYDSHFTNLKSQRRVMLWSLSNITAGCYTHSLKVLTAPVFDQVKLCLNDPDYRVVREALYVIRNAISNNIYDLSLNLFLKGIFEILINLLNLYLNDVNMVDMILTIISFILQSGEVVKGIEIDNVVVNTNPFSDIFINLGFATIIEKCQLHKEEKIYEAANEILKKYFKTEDIIN